MKRYFPGIACFAALTAVIGVSILGIFENQEMAVYDWLMRTRPALIADPRVAVIEIADDTLKGLGRWPLPREYHAFLINALTESGCRKIVFDIIFSEPSGADDILKDAIRKSGKVLLPVAFRLEESKVAGGVPAAAEVLGGVTESLKDADAGTGHINIFVDRDGKVRRLPLFIRHGGIAYPSIGLLAAVDPGVDVHAGNGAIPVDENGAHWINYPGKWTESFSHYSYLDVLKAAAARKSGNPSWLDLNVFKDKICFVGLTAAGTSDFRANPSEAVYPMVGAQASLCDSILRSSFVKRAALFFRCMPGAFMFSSALAFCLIWGPFISFVLCFALAFVYTGFVWALFVFRGIFIDLFSPLLSVALVYAVVLLIKFIREEQKRRLLEKELEIAASIQRSFLPPAARKLAGVDIRAFLKPAKFVGGDLYDIIALDGSTVGFFIGDVSGKGVSASLIMAQTVSLLRVISSGSRDPAEVLFKLNNQLKPLLNGRFVTAQYLVYHAGDGSWECACAGHMPFMVAGEGASRVREFAEASGPPLGLMENISYTRVNGSLEKGEKILMYTDGWTEARNSRNAEFGLEKFKEAFFSSRGSSVDDVLDHLRKLNEGFEGKDRQHDDLTALIIGKNL